MTELLVVSLTEVHQVIDLESYLIKRMSLFSLNINVGRSSLNEIGDLCLITVATKMSR